MCGIIGQCSYRASDPESFDRARDTMAARGPDGFASESCPMPEGGHVRFGHRRLSIQDLSEAGRQPMTSACGRYVMVYNGEVYNAPDLRRQLEATGLVFHSTSDTEVILEGFGVWGRGIVERLHGMFAFAIWDKVEARLFAARDRAGIKPFYFAVDEEGIAFASDARALRSLGFGREMDRLSMGIYLCLGYVPTPRSIWQGIAKLESGCILEWSAAAGAKISRYWSAPDDTDYETGAHSLEQLIDEIVEEQLLSDVPIGLFLSGGIDSSVIASSLAGVASSFDAVTALSIGFPGNEKADESPVAERTARQLGMTFTKLELAANTRPYYDQAVAALDEPLAYSAIVTQTAISQLAREAGIKVVLSGDGGDEVFGGYRWYARSLDEVKASYARSISSRGFIASLLPFQKKRRLNEARTLDFLARDPLFAHALGLFRGLIPAQVADICPDISEAELTHEVREALARHDAPKLPEKRRRQRIDLFTFCQDVVLPKVDRAGMAFGVEARPPLLDHRLIEWGLSRPISDADDQMPKNALRQILQKRGLGFLLDEPKRGFSLKSKNRMSRSAMKAKISQQAQSLGFSRKWAGNLHGHRLELETLYFLSTWDAVIKSDFARRA